LTNIILIAKYILVNIRFICRRHKHLDTYIYVHTYVRTFRGSISVSDRKWDVEQQRMKYVGQNSSCTNFLQEK